MVKSSYISFFTINKNFTFFINARLNEQAIFQYNSWLDSERL